MTVEGLLSNRLLAGTGDGKDECSLNGEGQIRDGNAKRDEVMPAGPPSHLLLLTPPLSPCRAVEVSRQPAKA